MPTYECDGCGACCRSDFLVLASDGDARREPRIAVEGRRLPASQVTGEYAYRLHPLPFLEACCFLDGDNRCAIYASRPEVCRRFAAGCEQCQAARRRHGLPLLPPMEIAP